ncbi:MAG: DUF305 domain-containing protein [Pseudonocardiaceae bacterium]
MIAGALITTLILASCGGADSSAGSPQGGNASAPPPSSQVSEEHDAADVQFARDMIVHHEQAVEMADLAETRAQNPEVKALAEEIRAAQQPEIDIMTGFLTAWGENPSQGGGMGGMDHSGMPGMSQQQMQQLGQAQGVAFDRMFLQMMINHHNGAIEMARGEQVDGQNPQAIELAKQIEAAQAAEVQHMQQLLQAG